MEFDAEAIVTQGETRLIAAGVLPNDHGWTLSGGTCSYSVYNPATNGEDGPNSTSLLDALGDPLASVSTGHLQSGFYIVRFTVPMLDSASNAFTLRPATLLYVQPSVYATPYEYYDYPAITDIVTQLLSIPVIEEAARLRVFYGMRLDEKRVMAVRDWERAIDVSPYLSQIEDRYYDPPANGRVLTLDRPMQSVVSVETGLETDGTGGEALVQGEDFLLRPYNAANDDEPYTEIEFLSTPGTARRSIRVSGLFGCVSVVPSDVWRAVLYRVLLLCEPTLRNNVSHGATEVRDDEGAVRFGENTLQHDVKFWRAEWERAVANYRNRALV